MNQIQDTRTALTFPITPFRAALAKCRGIFKDSPINGLWISTFPDRSASLVAATVNKRLFIGIDCNEAPSRSIRAPIPLSIRQFLQPLARNAGDLVIRLSETANDPRAAIEIEADDCQVRAAPDDITALMDDQEAMQGGAAIRIDADLLLRTMNAVRAAISREETRYYLNGIYIEPGETADQLRFTATDGHRLVSRLVEGVTHDLRTGFIFERGDAELLITLIGDRDRSKDGTILIEATQNRVLAVLDGQWRLFTKPIDGTYPDWRRIVPTDIQPLARLDTQRTRDVMRRLIAMHGRQVSAVKLSAARGASFVTATAAHPDLGIFTATIPGECFRTGEIGFQARYVRDAVETIHAPFTEIATGSERDCGPAIFASAGELTDPTTLIVVMPMRV